MSVSGGGGRNRGYRGQEREQVGAMETKKENYVFLNDL